MPTKLRLHLTNITLKFLNKLNTCHEVFTVECLVDSVEEKLLVAVLESVESILRDNANELISHNLLLLILSTLKWEKLVIEPQLLLSVRNLIYVIYEHDSLITSFIKLGIGYVLAKIMEKEIESQQNIIATTETDERVMTCHVIALFLPATKYRYWTEDINKISGKILSEGSINANATKLVKDTFTTLYSFCQLPMCPIENQVFLLKMICFAIDKKCLEDLIPIDNLLNFLKKLMTSTPISDDQILIGFAILIELGKCCEVFEKTVVIQLLKSMRQIVKALMSKGQFQWIWCAYSNMIPQWLNDQTLSKYQCDDNYLSTQIEEIDLIVRNILLDTEGALEDNYCRLKSYLQITLNLPDSSSYKDKLNVSSEGAKNFRALVTFVVSTVDAILVNNDLITIHPDLLGLDDCLHVPKSPMDIRLGLNKSSSFDRVLGPSKSKKQLFSNPLLRALRLLSIFYEVNENWAILFGYLSTDRLIDKSCYISGVLEEAVNNIENKRINRLFLVPDFTKRLTESYPFLLSLENRVFLFKLVKGKLNRYKGLEYIKKEYTLNSVVSKLHYLKEYNWVFSYNIGSTTHGPSKEFYSKFSKDCQNYAYDLWHGEPRKGPNGVSYVNSPLGLFPSPKPSRNPMAKDCLFAIGMVMARSIIDDHRIDINFSNAFYKCLFRSNLDAQQLSLADFKYVMPYIYRFLESLVDALREKWSIESNKTLSVEEKMQAMSKIECDGCSFEDLCVNFTLPGYPDVEMEEGGSEVLLSIDNLEKYLKLLTWWVLYKNPQNSIKEISSGFSFFINHCGRNINYFRELLYPHEYDQMFCGLIKEQWTVEYLRNNIDIHRSFDPEPPVVQYLFEVLSSLSASDQRNFLQFTTGTPRLPFGGLAALEPKLNVIVSCQWRNRKTDDYLPGARTCSNCLCIGEYSTKKVLEEKLLFAITEGLNLY